MSYSDALDEALCFGWIDGVRLKLESDSFWVTSAKRPETQQRRLATLIEDSAAGCRIGELSPPSRRRKEP